MLPRHLITIEMASAYTKILGPLLMVYAELTEIYTGVQTHVFQTTCENEDRRLWLAWFLKFNILTWQIPLRSLLHRQGICIGHRAWGQRKLRINFTLVFKVSQNFPSHEATRAISETLKTQVKLFLNFTRNHAINC